MSDACRAWLNYRNSSYTPLREPASLAERRKTCGNGSSRSGTRARRPFLRPPSHSARQECPREGGVAEDLRAILALLRSPSPTQSRAHCTLLSEEAPSQKVGLQVGPGPLKKAWCRVQGPPGSGGTEDSLPLPARCAERVLRGRSSLSPRLGGRPRSLHIASPSPGALTTPLCASQRMGLPFPSISGCPPQAPPARHPCLCPQQGSSTKSVCFHLPPYQNFLSFLSQLSHPDPGLLYPHPGPSSQVVGPKIRPPGLFSLRVSCVTASMMQAWWGPQTGQVKGQSRTVFDPQPGLCPQTQSLES
ncbi:uncharacterized protein LOC125085803 [Lutra lutra]|uniref:uncharacterized protein LOC125085803 n=1 Tax=Lutra lutra TaxID=9657 RepID=UPI001FD01332|nr:uncharacterized protein LOC125085803 [Lutra lutra]